MTRAVALDVGLMTHDLKQVPVYARRAEELGFGCLWSSETKHDPFLPLAAASSTTTRIKLGTAIAVAFPRSPMVLAHIAWDLQAASGGRFSLGLGTQVKGHNERRFSIPWESPGPRLREVVAALRAIWDCWQHGTKLNFKGRYFRFDLMTPFFNPGPIADPQIPVQIAGVNPYMCRMAGEIADGLHVHSFHSATYLREVVRPAVDEGLRHAGRSSSSFTYRASTMVVLGDTEEEHARSRSAVRQQIAFYASTRTYEPVLAVHGFADLLPHLHRKSLEGDWQGMASLVPDELVDVVAVTGTLETLGARIKERYAGLCDRIEIYPAWQPSLDDPRVARLVREFTTAGAG
jgi:probable F420-dependent oxidoreductase